MGTQQGMDIAYICEIDMIHSLSRLGQPDRQVPMNGQIPLQGAGTRLTTCCRSAAGSAAVA